MSLGVIIVQKDLRYITFLNCETSIVNCLFYDHTGNEGVIYNYHSSNGLVIFNCTFAANKDTTSQIHINDGSAVIKNTIISDNASTNSLTVLNGIVLLVITCLML